MKKLCLTALAVVMAGSLAFAGGGKDKAGARPQAAFHIGMVTGSVSQGEDGIRAVEALEKRYGKASEGGMIQLVVFPDNFMEQQEVTVSQIAALADDPLMKAVVVGQAVPGTAEAFRRIREKRPDILLFADESHEDPLVIQEAADMVVGLDFFTRGYTVPWEAKQLGADTFVHISFPRHMSYEAISYRTRLFETSCKNLGIKFVAVTAPDPLSDVGVAGAQQYILEQTPVWVKEYGQKAAFYCTNDAHTEPLIKQLLAYGGFFPEADGPSPLNGYPGALGIDLTAQAGDFPAILKKIEDTVTAKGGAGRFGTYAVSGGYASLAGLGEYARRIVEGTAQKGSLTDLFSAFAEYSAGAKWKGSYYVDASTGARSRNIVLVFMDTYIFGKGYLKTTELEIPPLF